MQRKLVLGARLSALSAVGLIASGQVKKQEAKQRANCKGTWTKA
jgi:hypothetical protein